ncbi:hypothetical protein [Actinomadura litoris]|uniref:Uncharacterized protein n=1 Tax=Actinomadura litoris TaxID=2678616 RepID=A0A7K1L8M1_9ACTN|nr:hypothetical protein [Actinomadura litoris]MUN40515.1 hypothetical protein [Actinomadura litoris]
MALVVCAIVMLVGGIIAFGVVDPMVHSEKKAITSTRLSAGVTPWQVSVPKSGNRHHAGKALAYRLSAGNAVVSIFTVPHLKRTWSERIFHAGPEYFFDGHLDFQSDMACASEARLTWRLHDKRGRFPLSHEVRFYDLSVPTDSITLTAQLDGPTSCTGILRLIDPKVTNESRGGIGTGASLYTANPLPEVETTRK